MFLENRPRPVRRANNLSAICEADCLDNVVSSTSHNPIGLHGLGSLTSHNPIGLHGLLRGQLYFMETECASCEVRSGL
jgi:hypothetical protein